MLGQPEVKWFGNIYSKDGMSPDPEKCKVIKDWPQPKSCSEVKSFLQTAQFNAKFLVGKHGEQSYPEVTEPLRILTKKNAKFAWGPSQADAFQVLKNRLCSDDVLVPYDTALETRLHVDASPIGTQATLVQKHITGEGTFWRPVNYTSRRWTPAEAGYSQIERESNGVLTGMYMNKMFTLGTFIEVVTDHAPLVPIYNNQRKPKQLRIDRHRTKLLPFQYKVIHEPGKDTPSDYGSRHPPPSNLFSDDQISNWAIEDKDDVYVNRVIEEKVPQAVTIENLQEAIAPDRKLQNLKEDLITEKYCRDKDYRYIFNVLTYIHGVIMRGDKLVIPERLQADVIGLAHEGNMGVDKTKNLLRETCWFPRMSKLVDKYVESCNACAAAVPNTPPVPLKPNMLPEHP